MSRSIASGSSSKPAGKPSTTQVRPGPCDSPAVMSFSAMRRRSLCAERRLPVPDRLALQGHVGLRGALSSIRCLRASLLGHAHEYAALGQPAIALGTGEVLVTAHVSI